MFVFWPDWVGDCYMLLFSPSPVLLPFLFTATTPYLVYSCFPFLFRFHIYDKKHLLNCWCQKTCNLRIEKIIHGILLTLICPVCGRQPVKSEPTTLNCSLISTSGMSEYYVR